MRRHDRPAVPSDSTNATARRWWGGALLIALLVPLFLAGLGGVPLLDQDEPYYAVPAREMIEGGSWMIPTFHGKPWFDKPVLFYWLIAGSYGLFGVSEFSARLASSLSGLGCALLLYLMGERLGLTRRAALLSALALSTGVEFVVLARAAVTDMTLTFLLTAGMLATAASLVTRRRAAGLAAGVAFGLAALTKGPVGLLVPGAALAAYALLAGRGARPTLRGLVAIAGTSVAVATPWYAWVAVVHPKLLAGFLSQGNLGRFVDPEHAAPSWYYLAVLALGLFPWSGALPFALVDAFRSSRRRSEAKAPALRLPLFCLCWAGAVLALFQLSASKLPTYVLPAFPPLALLLGAYWHRIGRDVDAGVRVRHPERAAALGLAAGLVVAAGLALVGAESASGGAAWFVAAALAVAGPLAAWIAVHRRALGGLVAAHVATTAGLVLIALVVVVPHQTDARSGAALVRELQRRGLAGQVAGACGVTRSFSLEFYLGRSFPRFMGVSDLPATAVTDPDAVWLVPTATLSSLERGTEAPVELVVQGPNLSAVRFRAAAPGQGASS